MNTLLKVVTAIALVAVAVFYGAVVLVALALILAAGFLLFLYWMISGVPFYVTKSGKRVAEYRRFRRVK